MTDHGASSDKHKVKLIGAVQVKLSDHVLQCKRTIPVYCHTDIRSVSMIVEVTELLRLADLRISLTRISALELRHHF